MANLRSQGKELHSGQQSKHYKEGNVMFRESDIKSKEKYMTSSQQWHKITQYVGGSALLNLYHSINHL